MLQLLYYRNCSRVLMGKGDHRKVVSFFNLNFIIMAKLSVYLGLRDRVEKTNQLMLDDMFSKFKTKQGLFQGIRNTYEALTGFADEPNKRSLLQ